MKHIENYMVRDECWSSPEPEYVGECENCLEEIYEGMEYIKICDGTLYCTFCFERYV